MARLAADAKMGYYPTPEKTLDCIKEWIRSEKTGRQHLLDPCCGEGDALAAIGSYNCKRWGIELDIERANAASHKLNTVVASSIFDTRINPLGCMGLLWLNPPYDTVNGKRAEMEFLKHSIKWLCPGGVLVFIVREQLFQYAQYREWIGQHFCDITLVRAHSEDFPGNFNQAVLFGIKRKERVEDGDNIPPPEYPHIETLAPGHYVVPATAGSTVFQNDTTITDEEIFRNRDKLVEEIRKITGYIEKVQALSPLLPLRKGHLVSLITAGILDGKINTPEGFILVKGFSDRVSSTRVEDDAEITTDTYSVGIRIIESGSKGGKWYDIR